MNNITDIANSNQQNSLAVEQIAQGSTDFIGKVFKSLKLANPAWRNNFKSEKEYSETKAFWLQTLVDEKLTNEEDINRALKKSRKDTSSFFPSVGQFIEWAKKPVTHAAHMIIEQRHKVAKGAPMPDKVKEVVLQQCMNSDDDKRAMVAMVKERWPHSDLADLNERFGLV